MSHATRRRNRVKRPRTKYDKKKSQSRGGVMNTAVQLILAFLEMRQPQYPAKKQKYAEAPARSREQLRNDRRKTA